MNGDSLAAATNGPAQVATTTQLPRLEALAFDPIARADASASEFGCAKVEARYDVSRSVLAASGHVRSTEDRAAIIAQLSKINGVEGLEASDLRVVGEPYCQLMLLFDRPEFKRSSQQRTDNMLEVGNPRDAGIRGMPTGSLLEFEFRAPNFRNYMYVDYFMSNGRVYHLLPTENVPGNQFLPNNPVKIGRSGAGRRIRIAPPLGVDVVVGIGSSARLFDDPRPRIESASDYISSLVTAITRAKQQRVSLLIEYTYSLIDTRANGN
jgi:hypothetical protein